MASTLPFCKPSIQQDFLFFNRWEWGVVEWLDHPLVTGIFILHFTVGFFFALFCLVILWRRETRERMLEFTDRPDLLLPFVKYPALLFFAAIVAGFPALVIALVQDMQSFKL